MSAAVPSNLKINMSWKVLDPGSNPGGWRACPHDQPSGVYLLSVYFLNLFAFGAMLSRVFRYP